MDKKQPDSSADALVSFLNTLITAHESRSIEELRESVKSMGMDADRLLARAREQVDRARERARLNWVTRARARADEVRQRIRDAGTAARLTRQEQIQRIREAAEGAFGQTAEQFAASFKNLESLPEQDLLSFVEDIEALRLLEEEPGDERP